MGQRPANGRNRRSQAPAGTDPQKRPVQVAIFATPLGWFGLAGSQASLGAERTVVALTIGHASADEVRSEFARGLRALTGEREFEENDWHPELRRALEQYTQGRNVDLTKFAVDLGHPTPFRKRVLEAARRIPFGQTVTYGELAARAGRERAARAVGTAMASNSIALLVPCHRVVASGGAIGGYSCRTGVELKKRLLEMEASVAKPRVKGRKSHGVRIR